MVHMWLRTRASGFLMLHSFTQELCAEMLGQALEVQDGGAPVRPENDTLQSGKQVNGQLPHRLINSKTDTKNGTGTLRRDSQLRVSTASFLVEVLWKQIPGGQEKVQETEGRSSYKARR